jgi:hypothetical protein
MSSNEDPLLAIWEAMNLIEEAQKCSNATDLPEILANAEIVLSNILKELAQRQAAAYAIPTPSAD